MIDTAPVRTDALGRPLRPLICASVALAAALTEACDWFSGVPDSMYRNVLPALEPYLPAARENHAIAMAFGARLGGRRPCVLIQNSGLGLLGDALFGLQHLYGAGVLITVTLRGELPWEEPQHRLWGERTRCFLEVLGLETFDLEAEGLPAVARAAARAFGAERPAALIVHRGNIDE